MEPRMERRMEPGTEPGMEPQDGARDGAEDGARDRTWSPVDSEGRGSPWKFQGACGPDSWGFTLPTRIVRNKL